MNNYLKDRMDEIELRTEQIAERKKFESEIELLEEKLRGFESNYERLKTTKKSNLEMLALKRVDLVVVKEAREFAEDMLKEKEDLLVEEKRRLDELHWKIWDERRRACDEVDKFLSDNNSVDFLNDYPLVLKTKKYAYGATPESEEIKKAVAEHPEIQRLRAVVAALKMEIDKADNSCLTKELQNVLTQLEELDRQRKYESDETQRLIEALERSHRKRIALEAEIADIGCRKADNPCGKPKLDTYRNDVEDISWIENEPRRASTASQLTKEEKLAINKMETRDNGDDESELDIKQEKKLKAKKWYEEYMRCLDETDEENRPKNYPTPSQRELEVNSDISIKKIGENPAEEGCFFSSKSERLLLVKKICLEDGDKEKDGDKIWEGKFSEINVQSSPKFIRSSQPVKSRFFMNEKKNSNSIGPGFLTTLPSKRNVKPKNEGVDAELVSEETPDADRKFEPLIATPRSFFTEVGLDNYPIKATHGPASSTTVQGILKVKRTVKFTPKQPSTIGNRSSYRQTKLDSFINFMLSDESKYAMERK